MTPEQKVKWLILAKSASFNDDPAPEYPLEDIDERYDELCDADEHWDAKSEVREGEVETGLPTEFSRHYESKAVAAKLPDGSWVGWTYWYGGGKHGEPEGIDWMDKAEDLVCVEREQVMTVREFSRPEETKIGG